MSTHSNSGPEEDMTPEEKLRMENELNKIKLQAEFGADFHINENLPADVENDFLKNIMLFEEQFKNHNTVKVFDYIGKPDFKKSTDLDDDEVSFELDRVTKIMEANQIALDVINEYDERTIYSFITDELFEHEMNDVRVPGMFMNFTYEEFHPNHDDDLRRATTDYFDYLMERDLKALEFEAPYHLITVKGEKLNKDETYQRIVDFVNAYAAFENNSFEISEVNFNMESGIGDVKFICSYNALLEGEPSILFSGEGVFGFEQQYDYWSINKINMPGFVI